MVKGLQDRGGQAILEWALVMPMLLFVVLGAFLITILINTKLAVSGAAREVARDYAIHSDRSRSACVASRYLHGTLLTRTLANCAVSAGGPVWSSGLRCTERVLDSAPIPESPPTTHCAVEIHAPSAPDDRVEVRISYWQHVFVPGLYRLLGGQASLGSMVASLEDRLPISASVVFRREQ